MCESNEDKLSRVQQMAHDDGLTWDLSPNDKEALAFLLSEYDRLQAMSGNVALVIESFNADAISDRDEMKRENRKLQAEVERLRSVIEECSGYCWNATHEPEATQAIERSIDSQFELLYVQPRVEEATKELRAEVERLREQIPPGGIGYRKLKYTTNDLVPYPDHWPPYYNGIGTPCDFLQGPCACGAFHKLYEWGR